MIHPFAVADGSLLGLGTAGRTGRRGKERDMNENSRIAVAELVGTMFLVIGGCGTAVFAADKVGYFGVATAFGLSLLIMAYAIGPVSGCHVNPAVTLGLVIAGKVEAAKLPYYWAGQVVGGLLGGLLLFIVYQPNDSLTRGRFATNGYGAHSPGGFPLISVIVIEVLMTALLLFVVLGTTHRKFPVSAGGLAVGGVVADPPDQHPDLEHVGEPGAFAGGGAVRRRVLRLPAALGVHLVPDGRWCHRCGDLEVRGRPRC